MIYLDTSAALAQLLAEERRPPEALWREPVVSSLQLEYEVWNRIHGRGLGASHGGLVRQLLARLAMLELVRPVLARALEPFAVPVRTLDALHLASAQFLQSMGERLRLASYDERFLVAARTLGLELYPLP
jgi:predicted nucleic acid-binding protein